MHDTQEHPITDHPHHWSPSARDAWNNVLDERPDLSGAEYAALEQAVELISAADLLDVAARENGPLIPGSTGQLVTNPALVEARQDRTAAATILARLATPSAGAKTNSQRGREAARARWAK